MRDEIGRDFVERQADGEERTRMAALRRQYLLVDRQLIASLLVDFHSYIMAVLLSTNFRGTL